MTASLSFDPPGNPILAVLLDPQSCRTPGTLRKTSEAEKQSFLRIARVALRVAWVRHTVMHMNRPTQTAVQELRESLDMSIRQAAQLARVDHTYLGRYERGQVTPSRHWLRRVATAFGEHVARLHEEKNA